MFWSLERLHILFQFTLIDIRICKMYFNFHHFLFDIEIRLKFSMNLLRKINEKYIHMRRVQCNDSSMLFRKEDIFASHKWSKRGLSQKKFTRCQALFFFVFSISLPILYSFWVSLLIKLYFNNYWASTKNMINFEFQKINATPISHDN